MIIYRRHTHLRHPFHLSYNTIKPRFILINHQTPPPPLLDDLQLATTIAWWWGTSARHQESERKRRLRGGEPRLRRQPTSMTATIRVISLCYDDEDNGDLPMMLIMMKTWWLVAADGDMPFTGFGDTRKQWVSFWFGFWFGSRVGSVRVRPSQRGVSGQILRFTDLVRFSHMVSDFRIQIGFYLDGIQFTISLGLGFGSIVKVGQTVNGSDSGSVNSG
ncbi:hypothetical protein Hdeb2414_s0299g00860901 [Helianthus debilis subsp. tardiflorus]